jgi:predicted protein tyrosine phosphatase
MPDPVPESTTTYRKKVLFVCAQNKIRSYTAEKMFAGSLLYDVKSRGVAKDARIKLTESDIAWADIVFVMEKNHKNRIAQNFRSAVVGKKIVCLFIEDIYEPMEEALIAVLRQQLAPYLLLPGDTRT